jgi:hypothetical protein
VSGAFAADFAPEEVSSSRWFFGSLTLQLLAPAILEGVLLDSANLLLRSDQENGNTNF